MTFFVAAFTALTTSGSAFLAATNFAGVVAAGVSSLGTVGGFASVLAGVGTVFGAVESIEAGKSAAANADFQRDQLLVEGRVAAANAKKEENVAREQLLRDLASTNAAAGSAGIQLTSGTVESGREDAFRQASRELSTIRTTEQIQQAGRRQKIQKLRVDASVAKRTGRRDAIIGLTSAASRGLRRG